VPVAPEPEFLLRISQAEKEHIGRAAIDLFDEVIVVAEGLEQLSALDVDEGRRFSNDLDGGIHPGDHLLGEPQGLFIASEHVDPEMVEPLHDGRNQVRPCHAALEARSEEPRRAHHRHTVGDRQVGLAVAGAELGILLGEGPETEDVDQKIDVGGGDVVRHPVAPVLLDKGPDLLERLVESHVVEGYTEDDRVVVQGIHQNLFLL